MSINRIPEKDLNTIKQQFAGVVGAPIKHSMSPILHFAGWQPTEFSKIELVPGELANYISTLDNNWVGLAITMPFKQEALLCADQVDGLAKAVGSVNTLVFQKTGTTRMTIGFNTDVAGIVNAFRECGYVPTVGAKAMILGSGATASSALAALVQLKADDVLVGSRSKHAPNSVFTVSHRLHLPISHVPLNNSAEYLPKQDLVVSTLPSGVADNLAQDLPKVDLQGKYLLDVSYDPYPSKISAAWEERGGIVVPGWLMLLHQAVDQIRLFTGKNPDLELMRTALTEELLKRGLQKAGF
ncbi:MAG: shikimate dehydrogenase [Arcanobacterium sp.]|nr:shikimate dehydrogenase [Arcanobacterium sp.]